MARKNYAINEACILAFDRQGRGQGESEHYLPWLTIRDVPSRGRSHRSYGLKTRRVHHTLSDGEHHVLLALEHDPRTLDIREQYPMARMDTYRAARDLGYAPPRTLDGTPYVLTIDFFVVQRVEGQIVYRPLTFKYSYDQLTPRQLQLLAIASLYWRRRGLTLEIIDETFYDLDLVAKYGEIRTYYRIDNVRGVSHELIQRVATDFGRVSVLRKADILRDYCERAGGRLGAPGTIVFDVVRHLLARGVLVTDLSGPTRLGRYTLGEFSVLRKE